MVKLFRKLASVAVYRWSVGRARSRLYQLNDHMLSDIGISRGEIDTAVRGDGPFKSTGSIVAHRSRRQVCRH